VVSAVDITYQFTDDHSLLNIAEIQDEVRLDQTGFKVAMAIEDGKLIPFLKRSMELRDGANGDQGALGILRASNHSNDEISVVFKYTSQGMGHGHFDKLSYFINDNSDEIIQDYGCARWVNIDQKAGGRYLKENTSWAKQSIAHNTLVVDGRSHFEGDYDIANDKHSEPWYFNAENEELQIVSAREHNAYPGTEMQRTLLLWKDSNFVKPLVIDLLMAKSEEKNKYELPFHFIGHLMQTNFSYSVFEDPYVMGEAHGFEHLFAEAKSDSVGENIKFNWFRDNKFYTLTSLTNPGDEILFARLGANDPEFNLRRDGLLIHRKPDKENALFLSVVESHGYYSPVTEIPKGPYSAIKELELVHHNEEYTIFSIESLNGKRWEFMLAHQSIIEDQVHIVKIGKNNYKWKGPFSIERKE
jgi:hypothetical protein